MFVIMLCDGLFPSGRSMETNEGEEEERRLFYVAITRAKNELYLSYPLERASFSKSGGDSMQRPSRFLSEIPRDLLNEMNLLPLCRGLGMRRRVGALKSGDMSPHSKLVLSNLAPLVYCEACGRSESSRRLDATMRLRRFEPVEPLLPDGVRMT